MRQKKRTRNHLCGCVFVFINGFRYICDVISTGNKTANYFVTRSAVKSAYTLFHQAVDVLMSLLRNLQKTSPAHCTNPCRAALHICSKDQTRKRLFPDIPGIIPLCKGTVGNDLASNPCAYVRQSFFADIGSGS